MIPIKDKIHLIYWIALLDPNIKRKIISAFTFIKYRKKEIYF